MLKPLQIHFLYCATHIVTEIVLIYFKEDSLYFKNSNPDHKCYKCNFSDVITTIIFVVIIIATMGVEHRILHILRKCSVAELCSRHLKDPYFIFNLLEMLKVLFVILFSKGHDELELSTYCLILSSHTGSVPFSYVDMPFLGLTSIFPFQRFQVPLNKGNTCYTYDSERINIHDMLMYKNRKHG